MTPNRHGRAAAGDHMETELRGILAIATVLSASQREAALRDDNDAEDDEKAAARPLDAETAGTISDLQTISPCAPWATCTSCPMR